MLGKIRYTRLKIWWNGWSDGRKNYPEKDARHPAQYVRELMDACENQLARLGKNWKQSEEKLDAEYHKAFDNNQKTDEALKQAEDRNQGAATAYEGAKSELDYLEHVSPSRKWYIVFFTFITLSEFPINSFVFELFGEARWLTMIMSALICFCIPWAAHITGKALKEGLRNDRVIATKFIVMGLMIIGLLTGISYMREKFFEGGVQQILGIEMDVRIVTMLFFLINGTVFLIAMWTSYTAHPRDPRTFHTILRKYREAKKQFTMAERQLGEAEKEQERATNRLHDVISIRKNGFEKMRNEAVEVIKSWDNHIRYYCKINVRYRKDGSEPVSFHAEPVYKIPEGLQKLEWGWDDEIIRPANATKGNGTAVHEQDETMDFEKIAR
ncbi:MAG: hypothetical protein IBX72_11480 [Nitrospirae bacterium]|nr:hypothetical protein [Nitrospirota bacterium]